LYDVVIAMAIVGSGLVAQLGFLSIGDKLAARGEHLKNACILGANEGERIKVQYGNHVTVKDSFYEATCNNFTYYVERKSLQSESEFPEVATGDVPRVPRVPCLQEIDIAIYRSSNRVKKITSFRIVHLY